MNDKKLKVGVWAKGFGRGTGPDTYFTSIKKAMAGGHELCPIEGPDKGGLDLVHVIDAKRVDLRLLGSVKAPVVADFHDDYWAGFTPYPSPDLPLRWIRQKQLLAHHLKVIRRADLLIVHTMYVKESLQTALGSEKIPEIFVVPYGINLDMFEQTNKDDKKTEEPLILFAGRDLFRKGFPVMARALPRVLQSHPGARVAMIGNEYWHSLMAARLISRGLPIEFLPVQSMQSLIEWYNRAGLLVLPSRQEAFGIVLIEAMAAGLPVVASRTGGIPEAVEDNVSGLLHEPGDADDLARKIIKVLADSELRTKLVAAGRERAKTFSLENMRQALEKAYQAALEKN